MMNAFVFGVAVGIFLILILLAVRMMISEYKENKRKWWLRQD